MAHLRQASSLMQASQHAARDPLLPQASPIRSKRLEMCMGMAEPAQTLQKCNARAPRMLTSSLLH